MEYILYATIDSTNNEAKRLISSGEIKENTCLTAERQSAGRGRQGKSFFSPDTGLYMTVVFPVDRPISSQVTVTTRTACAVAEAIEECTGKQAGIKWVNDIYINNKKCCGILCEAVNDYEQGRLKYIIIGIGVNIYTREWPEELRNIAGSLVDGENEADIEISGIKDKLCRSIAEKLETWIFKTSEQEFLEYYKGHSIVLGKMITFIENGESKEGCAVDIDENGGLIVKLSEGTGVPDSDEKSEALYKTLSSGEISVKVHM